MPERSPLPQDLTQLHPPADLATAQAILSALAERAAAAESRAAAAEAQVEVLAQKLHQAETEQQRLARQLEQARAEIKALIMRFCRVR